MINWKEKPDSRIERRKISDLKFSEQYDDERIRFVVDGMEDGVEVHPVYAHEDGTVTTGEERCVAAKEVLGEDAMIPVEIVD